MIFSKFHSAKRSKRSKEGLENNLVRKISQDKKDRI